MLDRKYRWRLNHLNFSSYSVQMNDFRCSFQPDPNSSTDYIHTRRKYIVIFKITTTMKRFFKRHLRFEKFVGLALLVYLFYMIATIFSSYFQYAKSAVDVKPKPLFKILKAPTLTPIINSSRFSSEPEKSLCSVTVAIILCEDDRYLTIKKSFPLTSNISSSNTSSQKLSSTISYVVKTPPKRQRIAKDFSRQINQTLVLLKSIAILSAYDDSVSYSNGNTATPACVEALVLSDKADHYRIIQKEVGKWSEKFRNLVKVTHVPVRYPPGSAWMKDLFRPCATLRLFLAELLPTKWESIVYLDTDIIFFQSVHSLWSQFEKFDVDEDDESEISGSNEESYTEEPEVSLSVEKLKRKRRSYNKLKRKVAAMAPCLVHYGTPANSVPFFGSSGLNAGVMLMNLTRMRTSQWTNKVRMVTTMFQGKIKLADQDILNIYFHFFPEELHLLSCDWNFRPFQCRRESYCTDPELTQGISALHGNALSFTAHGPEPLFRAVFQTFHKVKLDHNFQLKKFVNQLESALVKADENTRKYNSQCKQFGEFDVLLLNRLYNLVERMLMHS